MSEQSIELVKGVCGAFARGDVPAVLGAFADDIEWYEAEGMPYGGLHHGGEAVAQRGQRVAACAARSLPARA
jgi:ketosteroid isomerase-like protein